MSFAGHTFLFVFLPVTTILYLAAERLFNYDPVNNILLILFSAAFYAWADSNSLVVFAAISIFTYLAGHLVSGASERNMRYWLAFSLIILIGLLGFYKYVELLVPYFTNTNVINALAPENLIVPLGLSFVIFEAVSYVVDIYRGDAQKGNIIDCLTFLSLFPKLISGPIVLWKDFQSQLTNRRINSSNIAAGIDRIIIGYAKKAIIADSFAAQIALINDGIAGAGADIPTMWLRALLYFFRLYFDFSGYSDIAIGICNIFGFEIKDNFRYPYLSKSISEFWRRWHISLGTWLREYVYIPLGGNRKGNVYLNLAIVFLLTGIWHGSEINFLIWGALNAAAVVLERYARDKDWYKGIPSFIKWTATTVTILFFWIVFMTPDMADLKATILGMFHPMAAEPVDFSWQYYLSGKILLFLGIAIAGNLTGIDIINNRIKTAVNTNAGVVIKRVLLLVLFLIDILFIVNSTNSPFLYFQF